jgi:uncharacterized protein (TIRG00374 family)
VPLLKARTPTWPPSLLRLAIGVILVGAIGWTIDPRAIAASLASLDPLLFAVVCVLSLLDRALMASKWNLLLRARDIALSMRQAISLYFVGHLIGAFTPGAIGTDAYRVTALAPLRKTPIVVSTILLERLIGLAVIGLFALAALPVSARYLGASSTSIVLVIVAGATLAITTLVASLCPRLLAGVTPWVSRGPVRAVAEKLHGFSHAYTENRRHPGTLLAFTMLTALEVVLLVFINFAAARALGVPVSFGYLLAVMPLVHILVRLPISFQAIGVQEGLFAYFLVAAGFSAADGVSVALLLRVAELLSAFVPGAILLWSTTSPYLPPAASA